uniref:Uncharacterized protein n=1 Tax=Panagrolaimus davidi TaxID=227884 RepID=A0A914QT52_9BILA
MSNFKVFILIIVLLAFDLSLNESTAQTNFEIQREIPDEPGPVLNLNSTNFGKSFLIDSINEFSSLTIQGPTFDDYLDLFVAPQLDNSDQSYAILDSVRLYDGQGIQNFITTLRNEHTAGCLTPENVFSLEQANLTASAGSSGTCMTTILSTATVPFSPTNVLTLLNPTINSNQSFGVIAGIDNNFPYFYFNSQTASLWNSVYLFGTSFSFLLPANQSLEFSYAYTYGRNDLMNFNIIS